MKSDVRSQNSGVRSQKSGISGRLLSTEFWILNSVRSAFTLIELLVVMVIIAILAALTIGATKFAWTKAANSRAQGEIAALETSLESYKIDNGIYPPSTAMRTNSAASNSGSLLAALTSGSKQYFNFNKNQTNTVSGILCIVDPFGSPYNYYRNSSGTQSNIATFDLWSYGADSLNDTGDDLVNWRR